MRKYIFALLFVLTAFSPTKAQNVQLRAGGGFASHYKDAKLVGAFKVGLAYEYEFDQHFTVAPALYFYGKGWKDHDREVNVLDDNGNQVYDDEGNAMTGICSRSATANYIEVPVLFNYYVNVSDQSYIVLSAGPYAAIGIGGKQTTKGDATQVGSHKLYYDKQTFDLDGTHRFDGGLTAGVGFQFPSRFMIGLEADFGLLHFNKEKAKNISTIIVLSYQF